MPKFSDSQECKNAQQRLLCALLFPKCIADPVKTPIQQRMCFSTCANFFSSCNVQLTTQCKNANGTGPSDFCTGDAAGLGASVAVLLVAVVGAMLFI